MAESDRKYCASEKKAALDKSWMDKLLIIKDQIKSIDTSTAELQTRINTLHNQAATEASTLSSHLMLFKTSKNNRKILSKTTKVNKKYDQEINSLKQKIADKKDKKYNLKIDFCMYSGFAMAAKLDVDILNDDTQ